MEGKVWAKPYRMPAWGEVDAGEKNKIFYVLKTQESSNRKEDRSVLCAFLKIARSSGEEYLV